MLYAILAKRNSRSPYAVKAEKLASNIIYVEVNVVSQYLIEGLIYTRNALNKRTMESRLSPDERAQKIQALDMLIKRIKKGEKIKTLWPSVIDIITKKKHLTFDEVNKITWA